MVMALVKKAARLPQRLGDKIPKSGKLAGMVGNPEVPVLGGSLVAMLLGLGVLWVAWTRVVPMVM